MAEDLPTPSKKYPIHGKQKNVRIMPTRYCVFSSISLPLRLGTIKDHMVSIYRGIDNTMIIGH